MLALQPPFVDWPRKLVIFCNGGEFPDSLLKSRTSPLGIEFIKSVLIPLPTLRPTAVEALTSPWFQVEMQHELHNSEPNLVNGRAELIPYGSNSEAQTQIAIRSTVMRKDFATVDRSETVPAGICDICKNTIAGDYYNCAICNNGNFNLCAACVRVGKHCYLQDHWLIKGNTESEGIINSVTEIVKTRWFYGRVGGTLESEQPPTITLPSRRWRSYKKPLPDAVPYDYCYQCRFTFPSDQPPHRHDWEQHGTEDLPVREADGSPEEN
jgi:hypothetical protein